MDPQPGPPPPSPVSPSSPQGSIDYILELDIDLRWLHGNFLIGYLRGEDSDVEPLA